MLEAKGQKQEAADEFEFASHLRRDDWDVIARLLNTDQASRGWVRANAYLERDPYDGERLEHLAERHGQWGGSAIVALRLLHLMYERAPDRYQKNTLLEAEIYSYLGDYDKYFQTLYADNRGLSNSDRYIQWYDSARRNAQARKVDKVAIDWNTGIATISYSDGRVLLRQDDQITGRPILYQLGTAFVKAQYDARGHLERIYDSAGSDIRLTYDERESIRTIRTSKREELTFEYNSAKRPTKISLKGVGVLTVAYDSQNEVSKVDSSAGRAVAITIISVFQRLLDLVQKFKPSANELPQLEYSNPEIDASLHKLEVSEVKMRTTDSSVAAASAAWAKSANAYAALLIDHMGDRFEYAELAGEALDKVFRIGSVEGAATALREQTVRAAALWYHLMGQVRAQGLSAADWDELDTWQNWLSHEAAQTGSDAEAAKSVLEEMATQSLSLNSFARWEPRSYWSVPGFWCKFDRNEILPKAFRDANIGSVVVRRNHDAVAATDSGLLVLRHGVWEWYGFDELQGRFSKTAVNLNASSAITSLAEDDEGALWVGTAKGLVLLAGDYDGPARRWSAPDQALPSPRIVGLASIDGALFVGTESGLLRTDGERLVPFSPTPRQKVAFLRAQTGRTNGKQSPLLLVGFADGVYVIEGQSARKIAVGPSDDAILYAPENQLILLRGNELFSAHWDGTKSAGELTALADRKSVVKADRIYGLALVPVEDGREGIGILTDRGLSVYLQHHIEAIAIPQADHPVQVHAFDSRDQRSYLATSEGLYAVERGHAMGDAAGEVYDLLTDESQGVTFVARGVELQVVHHNSAEKGAQLFDSVAAYHLTMDRDGGLLTDDGNKIIAIPGGRRTARCFSRRNKPSPTAGSRDQ